jgi:TrmH family RNA methyltransferase
VISKSDIKLIRSLAIRKYRLRHGLFVVEGEKIVSDMFRDELNSKRYRLRSVYATGDWKPPEEVRNVPSLKMVQVSDKELKLCSLMSTPNKVLAIVEIPAMPLGIKETRLGITLVLDAIRDPGNLGTIIRMAHWFGIKNVICSDDSVDLYNPKTIQATMGSFLAVKVYHLDLPEFLGQAKTQQNRTIYGSYLEGESIYALKPEQNAMIVLGNESAGIDKKLEPFIDRKIYIPSFSAKYKPDSLNVASATAIILSELLRNQLPSVFLSAHQRKPTDKSIGQLYMGL